MGFFSDLSDGHQRLKERIHKTRIPLGTRGRVGMGLFYLLSPVVAGYFIMQWTNGISERNLGVYADRERQPPNPEDIKLSRPDNVKEYVKMQRRELGSLLHNIEEGKPTGDWRQGPPPDRVAA